MKAPLIIKEAISTKFFNKAYFSFMDKKVLGGPFGLPRVKAYKKAAKYLAKGKSRTHISKAKDITTAIKESRSFQRNAKLLKGFHSFK